MKRWLFPMMVASILHAISINEGLEELKHNPYGFSIVDIGITPNDLENFSAITIEKEWVYHLFGELETVEESIVNFLDEIGPNESAIILQTASRLTEIIHEVIDASNKETGWICLRSFIPTDRFDIPRWHVDGPYYNPTGPEDLLFKFVITLKGPTTLFYPLPMEVRKPTEKMFRNRLYMKNFCKQENIISPKLGEGAVFIGGPYTARTGLHSEPSIHENRLFLSIVPCTREQLVALEARVASLYPKDSRKYTQINFYRLFSLK